MKHFPKSKTIIYILILAFILCILPVGAFAEGTGESEAEETNSFLQPVDQKTEVPEGYIGIYTAEDMDNIRNNLSGKYILMEDIDLAPLGNWEPIGKGKTGTPNPQYDSFHPQDYPLFIDDRIPFTGEIDGNGHVIENMNIKIDSGDKRWAMAGLIASAENAVVKNLGIASASLEGKAVNALYYGGIIAEYCYCTIENCFNSASFTVDNVSAEVLSVYGITARVHKPHGITTDEVLDLLTLSNCVNYGNITISEKNGQDFGSVSLAGIGGFEVYNCINAGNLKIEVTGSHHVAPYVYISGITNGAVPVCDSINNGDISVVLDGASFDKKNSNFCFISAVGVVSGGGTLVDLNVPTVNCKNQGNVSVKLTDCASTDRFSVSVGGIAGFVEFAAGERLSNEGSISVQAEKLTALPDSVLDDTKEICTISVGGVFGTLCGTGSEYLKNCYNIGPIDVSIKDIEHGTGVRAGGICAGFSEVSLNEDEDTHMYFANCFNRGDIKVDTTTWAYVGGISGRFSLTRRFANYPVTYVENCYNTGKVDAKGSEIIAGAIAGEVSANQTDDGDVKVRNMYYSNSDLPCVGNSIGRVKYENATQLSDEQMKQKESYVGFNFLKDWGIDESKNDGYPYLRAFYGEIGEAQVGDANLDGMINTGDAVQILRAVVDLVSLTDEQKAVADIDGNGKINTGDAVVILRRVAGFNE